MISDKISLNGEWKLYYYEDGTKNCTLPEELADVQSVTAKVPGNVEISLSEAGVIPKELFKGMTTAENEKFENYHWWYKRDFEYSKKKNGRVYISFDAVDCFAEYYINGVKIGESENAFIPVKFDVTDCIKENGTNSVCVHIKPAIFFALNQEFNQYLSVMRPGYQSCTRKPAHSFGWDIFPRAVSAGLWKDVSVYTDDGYGIEDFGYWVKTANCDTAVIRFFCAIDMPYREYRKNVKVEITAECGESSFSAVIDMNHFKAGAVYVRVEKPKLWWPYGYGEANVYKLCYKLLTDDEVKDSGTMNVGIRTVELQRTDTMKEENHCFKFVVNGVDIMCRGSNWVPLDAYHSRDKQRYQKALELFSDTHCNILRVWGGGVYEQEEFYDYCDRHGIMIWQDFMFACYTPAQDSRMLDNVKHEAECVVKMLRHHPSIILWAGDNEIDELHIENYVNPGLNKINREILPRAVAMNDLSRPYLASSPYFAEESYKAYYKGNGEDDIFPERHLWGARDYFKADFYKNSRAHFVSETGYHGCPCRESVEKIVDKDFVWPIYNEQWALHSSDQQGSLARVKLMADQIEQLFGFSPDNLDDFILASQISQAEAKKYFIERIRIKKPYTSGVIWWNMLDGWPQMSDAVVDYFFEKKLAYYYIKESQGPFALMIDEMHDWNYTLVASNDTLTDKKGEYKVYDIDDMKVLAEGNFEVKSNSNKVLSRIPLLYSDKKFLVIEWTADGKKYKNHYLCGMPGFDFETYKNWLKKYKKL